MEEFKKFWTGIKDWYADPLDKYSAHNIIEWIDDYVEDPEGTQDEFDDPEGTQDEFDDMNSKYQEDTKEVKDD